MLLIRAHPAATCHAAWYGWSLWAGWNCSYLLSAPWFWSENNRFSAVWHLAPVLCWVAVGVLISPATVKSFLPTLPRRQWQCKAWARKQSSCQPVRRSMRVLCKLPPHGLRDGISSWSSGSSHLVQKNQFALQDLPGVSEGCPGRDEVLLSCSTLNSLLKSDCAGQSRQERNITSSLSLPDDNKLASAKPSGLQQYPTDHQKLCLR